MANALQLHRVDGRQGSKEGTGGYQSIQDWLLRQKVMLPDPIDGYVDRAALTTRCDPTRRRMTAIHAPGGFGKTTLLAEVCRRIRKRGDVAAWLTLDDEDDPRTLPAYLFLAFSEAGLAIEDLRATARDFEHGDYRVNLLIHGIEARGAPCVLALDDVHRLRDPDSVAIVNRLLQRGPPNLHLALAFRTLPTGLDVATPLLEDRGDTIAVEQLRFSRPDIARFFDTRLSRRELTELDEASQGWPIALRIHRNATERGATGGDTAVAVNWIDTRLWHGLSADDRDFVLDVGLFEWLDADLVDAVLPAGSMRRIQTMPALTGLLQSAGGPSDAMRLHPLVRQYCGDKRFRETPARYLAVHGAIAKALAGTRHFLTAMRHAVEAQNPHLVGEIAEGAGGFRIWLLEGLARLRSVEQMLNSQVLARFPRLGLLRCIALTVAGNLDAARATYADLHARTDGFTRDRDGGNDRDLEVDDVAYRFLQSFCGCQPIASPAMDALASSIRDIAEDRDVNPFVQGIAMHAMGEIELARANLSSALQWLTRARVELVRKSRYMTMHVDFRLGTLAMVEGRVSDAAKAYACAHRAARGGFLREAGPTVIIDVLTTELGLERDKVRSPTRRSHKVPELLAESGGWLDVFAAAVETTVQLADQDGGPAKAMEELERATEFARLTGRTTLTRCLTAWRISQLVAAGRLEEARDLWASAGLPEQVDAIVELGRQTWREMEAVSCAALRLLTAQSRFEAARELADALLGVCVERGLTRTRMRGLALAMAIEHRAGNRTEARARLVDYVELLADTDYARPLVQEREISLAVLNELGDGRIQPRLHNVVASLRGLLEKLPRNRNADIVPTLTVREQEILQRLEQSRDKEIGVALNLSEDGVRYHVRNIFQKLGARSRFEAAHRARSMGMLPSSNDAAS